MKHVFNSVRRICYGLPFRIAGGSLYVLNWVVAIE
jgi:hypothetical protein